MKTIKHITEKMKEIRLREKKISLKQVSEGTNITQSYIWRIENGTTNFSIKKLIKLLHFYNKEIIIRDKE